jgi:hypothetical protein
MPIFRDNENEAGTFGPSMSAAMSLHRHNKSEESDDEKDGKDKKSEHLKKAKHHLDKALEEHEGMERAEDEDMHGGGLSELMGGEEEE